jgi:hypothetical protein
MFAHLLSNPFTLRVLEPADVTIYTDNHEIYSDTTINLCGSGGIEVSIVNPDNELLYEGVKEGEDKNKYTLDKAGVYEIVGFNEGMCPDTSFFVEIFHIQMDYSFSPNPLDFGLLDSDTQFDDKVVTLTNNSNVDITFDVGDLAINGEFTIQSPALPFTVAAGTTQDITIRFSPTKSGPGNGDILFSNLCSYDDQLDITASKDKVKLTVDRPEVEFEYLLTCDTDPKTEVSEANQRWQ